MKLYFPHVVSVHLLSHTGCLISNETKASLHLPVLSHLFLSDPARCEEGQNVRMTDKRVTEELQGE